MDRPRLGSKATNQSQFLPTCVSDFVLFYFFPIYIYFLLLLNSILFLTLFSSDTVALLISKWCDRLLSERRLPLRCG